MADKVRLYYLGGLGPDDGTLTRVRAQQRVVYLPAVGDYIDVTALQAKDLLRKKVTTKEGMFDAFTRSSRLAQQAKNGKLLRGGGENVELTKDQLMEAALSRFSPEEILEMARQSGALVDAETQVFNESGEGEKPKNKGGRPRKNTAETDEAVTDEGEETDGNNS